MVWVGEGEGRTEVKARSEVIEGGKAKLGGVIIFFYLNEYMCMLYQSSKVKF